MARAKALSCGVLCRNLMLGCLLMSPVNLQEDFQRSSAPASDAAYSPVAFLVAGALRLQVLKQSGRKALKDSVVGLVPNNAGAVL